MILNDINTAVEFLRMTIDGDAICVTRADFVDLQASPSVFFDMDSQEGIILREWQQSPCPFRHLPLVWLLPILKELGIQLDGEQMSIEGKTTDCGFIVYDKTGAEWKP